MCGATVIGRDVTSRDFTANHRRAAHSIPHFTFRIPHAAVPHFTHSL